MEKSYSDGWSPIAGGFIMIQIDLEFRGTPKIEGHLYLAWSEIVKQQRKNRFEWDDPLQTWLLTVVNLEKAAIESGEIPSGNLR